MQLVSNLVKITIPNYLASLPIPDTVGGWFRLGGKFSTFSLFFYLSIALLRM